MALFFLVIATPQKNIIKIKGFALLSLQQPDHRSTPAVDAARLHRCQLLLKLRDQGAQFGVFSVQMYTSTSVIAE